SFPTGSRTQVKQLRRARSGSRGETTFDLFTKEDATMLRVSYGAALSAFVTLALVLSGNAAAAPVVFSASGPNAASIQGSVDAFRAALGNPNNANNPGPLSSGRREINWDGGGPAVPPAGTPFTAFQNIRGATFTTPGTGFVQAPPTAPPTGGLDTFFNNPNYATAFAAFSAPRLFAPS